MKCLLNAKHRPKHLIVLINLTLTGTFWDGYYHITITILQMGKLRHGGINMYKSIHIIVISGTGIRTQAPECVSIVPPHLSPCTSVYVWGMPICEYVCLCVPMWAYTSAFIGTCVPKVSERVCAFTHVCWASLWMRMYDALGTRGDSPLGQLFLQK